MSISYWRVRGSRRSTRYVQLEDHAAAVRQDVARALEASTLRLVGGQAEQRVERGEHDAELRCGLGRSRPSMSPTTVRTESPPGLPASRSSIDCDASTPQTSSPRIASAHATSRCRHRARARADRPPSSLDEVDASGRCRPRAGTRCRRCRRRLRRIRRSGSRRSGAARTWLGVLRRSEPRLRSDPRVPSAVGAVWGKRSVPARAAIGHRGHAHEHREDGGPFPARRFHRPH